MTDGESTVVGWISGSGYGVEALLVRGEQVCVRTYIPVFDNDFITVSVPVFRAFIAADEKGDFRPEEVGGLYVIPVDPDETGSKAIGVIPGRRDEFADAVNTGKFDSTTEGPPESGISAG